VLLLFDGSKLEKKLLKKLQFATVSTSTRVQEPVFSYGGTPSCASLHVETASNVRKRTNNHVLKTNDVPGVRSFATMGEQTPAPIKIRTTANLKKDANGCYTPEVELDHVRHSHLL